MKLDRIDRKILAALHADCRISNLQLAEKVGLTATPCARRVRILEEAGLINAYRAELDIAKLGLGFVVLVLVHLDSHRAEVFDAFDRSIIEMPEVLDAYLLTGSREYLLKVAAKDLHSYTIFQRERLLVLPHILTVDSLFVLREVKRSGFMLP